MAARSQHKSTAIHLEHLSGNFKKIVICPKLRDSSVTMMHLSSCHNYLVYFNPCKLQSRNQTQIYPPDSLQYAHF